MSPLCLAQTSDGVCPMTLERLDSSTWVCPLGHRWFGTGPSSIPSLSDADSTGWSARQVAVLALACSGALIAAAFAVGAVLSWLSAPS